LPIKSILEESIYEDNQARSDASLEYNEFELSCDKYAWILNELMRPMRATHCFDVLPKDFNNS